MKMKLKIVSKVVLAGLAALMLLQTVSLTAQESRKLKKEVQPVFPELARQAHVHGAVKLQVEIAPSGKVRNVTVLGGHPLLIDSAVQAVKTWQYEPASDTSSATVVFNFSD
jgi:TonB family protein